MDLMSSCLQLLFLEMWLYLLAALGLPCHTGFPCCRAQRVGLSSSRSQASLPCGLWLLVPHEVWPCTPCVGRWPLNQWTTRKVSVLFLITPLCQNISWSSLWEVNILKNIPVWKCVSSFLIWSTVWPCIEFWAGNDFPLVFWSHCFMFSSFQCCCQ